ncbi:MAG TPA: hypothetical protein VE011_12130 [Candidatus Dormibacteraeota bacterium]|nr:hypothetical protein [Candidatus Dormibacteraeota bacterium]
MDDSQPQPTPVPTTPMTPAAPGPARAWTPDPVAMPATTPVGRPVRKGPSARILNTILAGALVLAAAGIAFAVGRMTAPAAAASGRGGNLPGGGQGFNGYFGGRQGGGAFGSAFAGSGGGVTIQGKVDAVSSTTLTLKLASGQTIQIALDPTTTYHSQANASASDVVTGGTVQVQLTLGRGAGGAGSEDGTVTGPTARDITVVP